MRFITDIICTDLRGKYFRGTGSTKLRRNDPFYIDWKCPPTTLQWGICIIGDRNDGRLPTERRREECLKTEAGGTDGGGGGARAEGEGKKKGGLGGEGEA